MSADSIDIFQLTDWRCLYESGQQTHTEKAFLLNEKENTESLNGATVDTFDKIYIPFNDVAFSLSAASPPATSTIYIVPFDLVRRYEHDRRVTANTSVEKMICAHIRGQPLAATSLLDMDLQVLLSAHTYAIDVQQIVQGIPRDYEWKRHGSKYVHSSPWSPGLVQRSQLTRLTQSRVDLTFIRRHDRLFLFTAVLFAVPVFSTHAISRISDVGNMSIETYQQLISIDDDIEEFFSNAKPLDAEPEPEPVCPLSNITESEIPISKEAVDDLEYTFFTSDSIIDYMIKRMEASHCAANHDVFVFNSMIMNLLATSITPFDSKDGPQLEEVRCLYESAIKGGVPSCVFDKDYIFFPCNSQKKSTTNHEGGMHWYLYLFYKPFAPDCQMQMAYVIDSFYDRRMKDVAYEKQHAHNVIRIRLFLQVLLEDAKPAGNKAVLLTRSGGFVNMPQQPAASNACGYYVCKFIELFLSQGREGRNAMIHLMCTANPLLKDTKVFEREFEEVYLTIDAIKHDVVRTIKAVHKEQMEQREKKSRKNRSGRIRY